MSDILEDKFALINDEIMTRPWVGMNQFNGAHRNFTDLGLAFNEEADAVAASTAALSPRSRVTLRAASPTGATAANRPPRSTCASTLGRRQR